MISNSIPKLYLNAKMLQIFLLRILSLPAQTCTSCNEHQEDYYYKHVPMNVLEYLPFSWSPDQLISNTKY